MTETLFPIDDIPEIPLLRPSRDRRGAQISDERLGRDYPPIWHRCEPCGGTGRVRPHLTVLRCLDCDGMGSVKARVRLSADHRCVRCGHPYMPKGDAKILGVAPSPYQWSPCDELCTHGGPIRIWSEFGRMTPPSDTIEGPHDIAAEIDGGFDVDAEWRILTVHHLDGDKANLAWWNLASLCQRCHLEIQARVVLDRVYPHPHSAWFKPYAAGYYASVYLGQDLTRAEVEQRMDELLALELDPAYSSQLGEDIVVPFGSQVGKAEA